MQKEKSRVEWQHIPCMGPALPVRSWILNSKTSGGSFDLCLVTFSIFYLDWVITAGQPMCLQNPSWFFLYFYGSEEVRAWDEHCSSFTQPEPWWVLKCLERGWCLSVHFLQLQSTVIVLQNRLDWQNVSSQDCFLNTKEEKQKYCWK